MERRNHRPVVLPCLSRNNSSGSFFSKYYSFEYKVYKKKHNKGILTINIFKNKFTFLIIGIKKYNHLL